MERVHIADNRVCFVCRALTVLYQLLPQQLLLPYHVIKSLLTVVVFGVVVTNVIYIGLGTEYANVEIFPWTIDGVEISPRLFS